MQISILNSFSGDNEKNLDTSTEEGRAQAAKLVGELLRSGSAVFLEREVNKETYTYRVMGYDEKTNKLTIRIDSQVKDDAVEVPKKNVGRKGRKLGPYRKHHATIDANSGRMVSVAPRSGG